MMDIEDTEAPLMDVVYVNKDGENPELRYSLRTLVNVDHGRVWVFGGAPSWLNLDTVVYRRRVQGGTPYSSSRGHLMAACNTADVSDPFLLWNDDFYAMKHVGTVPVYHRGPMARLLEENLSNRTMWVKGMRETASLMDKMGMLENAVSYDVHLPLVIHKSAMREAMRLAGRIHTDAIHLRTLYGAVAELGGVEHVDPKMLRRSDPFPDGAWLSSSSDTFRSPVEPVLRYLFRDKSPYEKD